jgi:hypothetical protein
MKHIGFIQNLFEFNIDVKPNYNKFVKNIKLDKDKDNNNNFYNQNEEFTKKTNQVLSSHISRVSKFLGFDNYFIRNCWIQKYHENDLHSLHIHSKGLQEYSFIYYIDSTKNSSPTYFYNLGYPYIELSHHKVIPEKGKLIVFLGCIPHEVRNNKDKKRLIVSGNICFTNNI